MIKLVSHGLFLSNTIMIGVDLKGKNVMTNILFFSKPNYANECFLKV